MRWSARGPKGEGMGGTSGEPAFPYLGSSHFLRHNKIEHGGARGKLGEEVNSALNVTGSGWKPKGTFHP